MVVNRKIAILGFAGVLMVALPMASALADSPPHVDTSGVNMQPAYPATAIAGHESGSVQVGALVREDGTVKHVVLHKSSGFDDLDSAALSAVKGWKFTPAMKGGGSAEDWATVQLEFQPPAR